MADNRQSRIHGIIGSFKKTSDCYHAAEKCRDFGFKKWDVFTPFPVHGMDAAMGMKRSGVPRLTLLGGITGFTFGTLMVWFLNGHDYPLEVGGKPYFSPIYPFPVMYECTILFAAFGTFFGQFIFNMLPRHNHPVFNHEKFARASDDTFFILIEARDPKFDLEKTRSFLASIGAQDITPVEN